ncbi:hypothetical protein COS55_02650 [Candidatus Shapirobacteria bacterium CG03_land_8_20_14_0_80_40_19]|uniref:Peptidase M16 n=2 Tax=Candidatus Shapironibacteriota TaxID=1752721 RepID=A0A2M7BCY0_9BACT|nr:MAG: hypothetical protein COS55_02650 [Candidatus Shapirobacteria bacterium CG03_land_8_20_14_0_80_40_19]
MTDQSQFMLSNGLRVITAPMNNLPSATVLVMIGAGSRYENKNKAGLSHFLEHMIFKGTRKRPSAFEISSLVDSVGGQNNAFTSKDHTGYFIKLQKNHLELAFDLLSDTLKNSLFAPEEIERERGTILEEINMYEDTPMYDIDEVFYNLMFDGHPLGWSVAGDKKTVGSIVREDFMKYCDRFYQGSDMVLAVAGGVREEKILKLAEKYFSSFTRGEKEKMVEFKENQAKPRLKIKYKQTDQCHLYLGYPSFSFFDKDKVALAVLGAILGGGMSSRLFIEVRERRGLAYYVKAVSDLHHETGYFAARAGVNIGKAHEAVKVILDEFGKVKKGEVKQEELNKAKEYLKGHVALDLEDSLEVALWYGRKQLLQEETETPQEMFAKIDKVTLEDVNRVAKRVLVKEKVNLAMIGPLKEEEKFLELIS